MNLTLETDGLQREGNSEGDDSSEDEAFMGCASTYDPHTSEVDGFLVDMDGTMYRPGALIPGAILFHEWLRTSGKPVVYLSNTGAKDGEAVRQKLRAAPYRLQTELIPKGLVYTAAEAQCAFMSRRRSLPLDTYSYNSPRNASHLLRTQERLHGRSHRAWLQDLRHLGR